MLDRRRFTLRGWHCHIPWNLKKALRLLALVNSEVSARGEAKLDLNRENASLKLECVGRWFRYGRDRESAGPPGSPTDSKA